MSIVVMTWNQILRPVFSLLDLLMFAILFYFFAFCYTLLIED